MKGRDLIVYILNNNLEDEPVFKDGKFIGFLTDSEVAVKLGVGVDTVKTLVSMKILPGVKIGENFYIFGDALSSYLRGEDEKKNN